ncbi:YeeE/YedE thiosulfate transporter family protein [Myroides sp. JBRI-B21084]|uniref:YeeE/YedE family protein n=1 Tax=Myroides sp. JBRI-B21084 TaxID=3119977 RepID=UPI0026E454FD|nr:YeeE/YedE thiosulfate transporter family protein [Paenimyroides cloacae]WKW47315.1 YeeE/YedE thiosulfate transporter family protein [Paenimyroides cloacae]
MDWILQPWPWYISGPLITLTMFILLVVGKNFGMSANLRTLCTICGANKTCDFFCFDWKLQRWNLLVMLGAIIGGFIATHYLSDNQIPNINQQTIEQLHQMGIESAGSTYTPIELFGSEALSSPKTIIILLIGGVLVGFGSRYAGGCTSGHSISGISNLQIPSLIATIGFFIGGLIMVHVIFPFIF